MKVNARAIHATTASPFVNQLPWGRCTRKGKTLYLHVFNWPADGKLFVPLLNENVKAKLLAAPRTKIKTQNGPDGLVLELPSEAPDKIASVIELRVKGELKFPEAK
jgi:alpha-L-fucosidase